MAFPQSAFQATMALSSSISLGTTTQTLGVGSSASVTLSGPWPVNRSVHVNKNETSQNLTTGAFTTATWASASWDPLGIFDNVNDRITPNIRGKWLFILTAQIDTGATGVVIECVVTKNGSATSGMRFAGHTATTASLGVHVIGAMDMNGTTDYSNVLIFHNDSVDRNLNGSNIRTFFEAHYLGA